MGESRLVVWYNTRCPVCDAGISRQRRKLIAAVQAGAIAFHDINLEPEALAGHGASLEDVRRRLHATDETGRLLVPTSRSPFGISRRANAGWPCSWATPRCAHSRDSSTTASPICFTPGTGAQGTGRRGSESPRRLKQAGSRRSFTSRPVFGFIAA